MTTETTYRPRAVSPFVRLAALLGQTAPGLSPIDLSIGEPKHAVPDFIVPVLAADKADYGRYPPGKGTLAFREAAAAWLERRFRLTPLDRETEIVILNGSREGLFSAALVAGALKRVERPAILVPNPYYAAYAAAAPLIDAETVPMAATAATGFLPDLDRLDPALLDRTVCAFLASPANPQGAVAEPGYLARWIALARRHRFYLFADECYSEIYADTPPVGALQVAQGLGEGYSRVVTFNSLSKRSNLAGMRVGMAAGDADFLDRFMDTRNVASPQVPIPLQNAAIAAFADEAHVEASRALYAEKFAMAADILGAETPAGGFFLWLDVAARGGGEAFAREAWARAGIRVVPGRYLGQPDENGVNPGDDYVRVALVPDPATTREALNRMAEFLT